MEIAALDVPDAARPAAPSRSTIRGCRATRNIFHVIRDAGSLLLQHPYESFSTVGRALPARGERGSEGARDQDDAVPHVDATPRSSSTCATRRATASRSRWCVELKARFDEAANIQLASRLEDVGIHVTYGVVGLKTHCKVILVVRQDYDGLRRYAHIGTGNYHAGTARLYTDLGLLTCDDAIGQRSHRAVQLPDHRLPAEARLPASSCRRRRCSRRRCSTKIEREIARQRRAARRASSSSR